MKNSLLPSEHRGGVDAHTGAVIHQLTSAPCINHATYFLQSSITPDGQTLIFTSYRSGSAQLFSVEQFPHGPIRQWTGGEAIHPFSPAIHPDGRRVFFVRGGSVWAIHRDSLEEFEITRFRGAQLGELSLSSDGLWLTAAIRQAGRNGIAVGYIDGAAWKVIPFPRTVIHPQFHPIDPEWIEFAADPAPRIHRVRRDGSDVECLYEHGNDEFVVHETFLGRTGGLVYSVWPHGLWRLDWQTGRRTPICEFNAWHITPNRDGTRILCDTNHPDLGLFLIDAATGARRPLCLSGASNGGSQWRESRYALAGDFEAARSATAAALSWMEVPTDTVYGPQWTHPHPSFSPDEKLAVFTSDRSGSPQVYAVEIK
ncbi:MAG: PD40 domain-containing protein [Candidatus Solibacter usitatus]|nr:PD40 domain-containing protein [Candidatus Solibacter usitatus]